jgi:quaternary ammonium compound-resistance protein SugE
MGWIFLLLAGGLEVAFTTTLRMLIKAPNSILLNVIFVVLVIASFACLQQAVRSVPLGTGYAVWTGIGAVGTVIVGGRFFLAKAFHLFGWCLLDSSSRVSSD